MPAISLFSFADYNVDLIVNFPNQFEMCVMFFCSCINCQWIKKLCQVKSLHLY